MRDFKKWVVSGKCPLWQCFGGLVGGKSIGCDNLAESGGAQWARIVQLSARWL